jgi:ELWxxDGT repeat protein
MVAEFKGFAVGAGRSGGRLRLLALEPRMMFDGAAVATAAEATHDASSDAPDSGTDSHSDTAAALAEITPPAASAGGQVYFVDGAIQDREAILAAIPSEAQVIVLDPTQDGVARIGAYLSQYSDLSAIHVISHGAVGQVSLGSVTLAGDNADAHAGALGQWGRALAETGDILLYGCSVGADGAGAAFVDRIAGLTGADVAASDDPTGSVALGGDWVLEKATGPIDVATLSPDAFGGLLDYAMLKDILSGAGDGVPWSFNANKAVANGILFFAATDGANGVELWKSDGTTAGTVLVKDINGGAAGSSPQNLFNLNGTLYFTADDGVNGRELWKSDGTAAGTVMVKDISGGSSNSSPRNLTDVNGTLFFTADDGVNGWEVWKSDGTAAGTTLVSTTVTGADYSNSGPAQLINLNGTLLFSSTDGSDGISPIAGGELWRSDGTPAGTVLVKDINPGGGSSQISNMVVLNGEVYFSAITVADGRALWKSDGTAAGTVMVKDVNPTGTNAGVGMSILNVNGALFFGADSGTTGDELWKSDGTAAGTVLVKDINSGSSGSTPYSLTSFNGALYFTADDGFTGRELWKSDGTAAGTVMVKNIGAGFTGGSVGYFIEMNGALFFTANDGVAGSELWRTDGTAAGTFRITDINPGSGSASPLFLAVLNNKLYFSATDGSHGLELWSSDGLASVSVASPTVNEDTDSGAIAISRASNETHYKITNITGGTLYSDAGYTTQIANGSFIANAGATTNVYFRPTADRNTTTGGNGSFTLQASNAANDGGLTGSQLTSTITLTAVADTPSVTNASGSSGIQTSSGLVLSRAAGDGAETTHFKITGITNGTLYKNDGTTQIANGSFITFAEGNAGLKFTPSGGGNGGFTAQASLSNADGGLGGSTVTATITVSAAVASPTVNEDTDSGAIAIVRGTNETHYKITGITGGTLYSDAGYTNQIANGSFIANAGATTNVYFRPTANRNTALGGNGAFTLQAATAANDGGLTGSQITSTITLTPVADTPSATSAITTPSTQTTSGLVLGRSALDGAETTHFKIIGVTNGTLYKNDGTTQIANGSFITFAEGNAGLKFTPSGTGQGSFVFRASSAANDGGLGGSAVTANILVNRSPAVVAIDPAAGTEKSAFSRSVAGNFSDPDAGDSLTFSATGLPPGLTIHPTTGVISGIPTSPGPYQATITATDTYGGAQTSAPMTVTIAALPPPPSRSPAPPPPPPPSLAAGLTPVSGGLGGPAGPALAGAPIGLGGVAGPASSMSNVGDNGTPVTVATSQIKPVGADGLSTAAAVQGTLGSVSAIANTATPVTAALSSVGGGLTGSAGSATGLAGAAAGFGGAAPGLGGAAGGLGTSPGGLGGGLGAGTVGLGGGFGGLLGREGVGGDGAATPREGTRQGFDLPRGNQALSRQIALIHGSAQARIAPLARALAGHVLPAA